MGDGKGPFVIPDLIGDPVEIVIPDLIGDPFKMDSRFRGNDSAYKRKTADTVRPTKTRRTPRRGAFNPNTPARRPALLR